MPRRLIRWGILNRLIFPGKIQGRGRKAIRLHHSCWGRHGEAGYAGRSKPARVTLL